LHLITGADAPSKHAPPHPVYLSETVTTGRLVEALEHLPFNSRQEGRLVIDRVVRNYLIHAAHATAADPDQTIHDALAPDVARSVE
jgi:hypothetical protein